MSQPLYLELKKVNTYKRITAIDLGTNSFHAVIVDVRPDGSYAIVDSLKEMVELGKNGVGKKMTSDEMGRAMDAMRKISRLCDHQKVERIIAYATSAIREAPNGGEFIQKVIDELQIKIRPIPGYKEAELIGFAVQHGMSLGKDPSICIDIGGGSTEFVILNKSDQYHRESHKTGVSRMTAKFVKNDPITKDEIKDLDKYYRKQLKGLFKKSKEYNLQTLIGSSGTMQNIASMIAASKGIDTSVTLNEFVYTAEDFMKFYKTFMKSTRKKRLSTPGLDEKRVDFILAGLVLVRTVIKKLGITHIKTSTQAMREGIIVEYIHQDLKKLKLLAEFPETRPRSIYELCTKFKWPAKHSRQVADIAIMLFDELSEYHDLDETDLELLEYACLMHDIGYHISQRKHHKHSLYIIENSGLRGFKQDEIQIMAHVARYHRRSTPKKRHRVFMGLSSKLREKITILSAFMRVADGLDRSHYQNVIDLRAEESDGKMKIYLTTKADPELEIWGAARKSELMEEFLGMPMEFIGEEQRMDKVPRKKKRRRLIGKKKKSKT